MSRILLADDHLIVAQGIASFLQAEHDIIAIAKNGEELIELSQQHSPDLVITDISMGEMTGITATSALKKHNKAIKVICLSMHDEPEYVHGAIAAGADGYVLKHQAGDELKKAIDTVLQGEQYITTAIAIERDIPMLSARQIDVLQLLAKGYSAKKVADTLFISSRTVEFHKYTMMRLLEVKTSANLIQYAVEHGLVSSKS